MWTISSERDHNMPRLQEADIIIDPLEKDKRTSSERSIGSHHADGSNDHTTMNQAAAKYRWVSLWRAGQGDMWLWPQPGWIVRDYHGNLMQWEIIHVHSGISSPPRLSLTQYGKRMWFKATPAFAAAAPYSIWSLDCWSEEGRERLLVTGLLQEKSAVRLAIRRIWLH